MKENASGYCLVCADLCPDCAWKRKDEWMYNRYDADNLFLSGQLHMLGGGGHMDITLTANAGICVSFGEACVLVDALHEKKTRFSGVSMKMREDLLGGICGSAAAFVVTHGHADHFSEELAEEYMARHPSCMFVGPVHANAIPQARQCLVSGYTGAVSAGSADIRWLRLTHEGDEYADVPNYGYRISCGGESFVVLGDASVRETRHGLEELIGKEGTDAVIVNFPVLALRHGREALRGLPVRHIAGFHLPFEEDDTEGYRASACRAAPLAADKTGIPVSLLSEEGQSIHV